MGGAHHHRPPPPPPLEIRFTVDFRGNFTLEFTTLVFVIGTVNYEIFKIMLVPLQFG